MKESRSAGASPWPAVIPLLPRALFEPRLPARAIVVGWLTAFLPSIALGAAVTNLLPSLGQPDLAINNPLAVLLVALFAPLAETLIMGAVLVLLLKLMPATAAVAVSALGWGIAHSLAAPAWGLVIWWPFLVFSILFVTWRQHSLLAALAMPAAVHALQNLLPALLLLGAARA